MFLLASEILALHGYYAREREIYVYHIFFQTSKAKLNKQKLEIR